MEIQKVTKGIGILIIEGLLIYFDVLGKLLDFGIFNANAFFGIIALFSFAFLGFIMILGFPYAISLIWEGFKE